MAEIELSVLARQRLNRRMEWRAELQQETEAWKSARKKQQIEVTWQFTTAEACIRLHCLYPTTQ
jgi:hypothetical protein